MSEEMKKQLSKMFELLAYYGDIEWLNHSVTISPNESIHLVIKDSKVEKFSIKQ